MTWVWDNATQAGADLLILLAIADFCNDDGECYPGVERIAKKARVSESHSQTLIRKMKDDGTISVVLNAGIETGHGATNRYYVNGYRKAVGLAIIPSTKTSRMPTELRKPKKSAWGIADNTPIDDSTSRDIIDSTSGVLPIIPKLSVEALEEPILAVTPRGTKKSDSDVLSSLFNVNPQSDKDWKYWGGIARDLKAAGILVDEYSAYIAWVKKLSATQGNWPVTENSLNNKGRPSLYISEKENKANTPAPKNVSYDFIQDTTPEAELIRMAQAAQERGES